VSHPLLVVVGTRPNFVKVAPVLDALGESQLTDVEILHTGQHYDRRMSGSFLEQLGFPEPTHHLGVGSGSHAEQTAAVLIGVERVLMANRYAGVLVPGDVNSTLAAALAAAKLGVPVIHLEAGLRSGDWSMPEEINRVLCDRLADLLLCHSAEALDNLAGEGLPGERAVLVGNTMIDSLLKLLPLARSRGALERLGLRPHDYILVTIHRPALVDDKHGLQALLEVLSLVGRHVRVVLPLHPRTRARLQDLPPDILVTEPLEYLDFIELQEQARLVITDSGGVQEEASVLGVPCLTYRTTTERPVTITHGTNRVVGLDPNALRSAIIEALEAPSPVHPPTIPLWDGRSGPRAAQAITGFLSGR